MVRRFFQDYKILERKSVEVEEIQPAEAAFPVIDDTLRRYSSFRRSRFRHS
jgi:inorganic pyrophosphatase